MARRPSDGRVMIASAMGTHGPFFNIDLSIDSCIAANLKKHRDTCKAHGVQPLIS